MQKKHISSRFDRDIKQLTKSVNKMIDLVKEQLCFALVFYKDDEAKNVEKFRILDKKINTKQSEIDDLCLEMIVKHSPLANDLRSILSIIKIVSNLERMGDQYLKFIEQVKSIKGSIFYQNKDVEKKIHLIITTTNKMLELAQVAFEKSDVKNALAVVKMDEKVDQSYYQLLCQLGDLLVKEASSSDLIIKFTDFVIALRCLERFGDQVVNVANLVIYAVENHNVAHFSYSKISKILSKKEKK